MPHAGNKPNPYLSCIPKPPGLGRTGARILVEALAMRQRGHPAGFACDPRELYRRALRKFPVNPDFGGRTTWGLDQAAPVLVLGHLTS
jgi:hypothetical protein